MMNMQRLAVILLRHAAPLAFIPVAFAGSTGVGPPRRPIVGVESATPCRVSIARHAEAVRFVEALPATVAIAAATGERAELRVESLAARRADQPPAFVVPDKVVGPLPRAAALAITEVVILDGAGKNLLRRAAPIARDDGLLAVTVGTDMALRPSRVPRRAVYVVTTSGALNNHAISISSTTGYASSGNESIGVELSDEYADIARARLAWWHEESTRQPMLPMFADAVP